MAAAHLFMKLLMPDSSMLKGEGQVAGFEQQIILDDWNWGISRAKKAGDKTSRRIEPSVFSFSKPMDRSTSALLACLKTGKLLPSAEITLEEHSQSDFELVMILKSIRVTEYSLQGQMNDAGGNLDESWVFNYHTVEVLYKPSQQNAGRLSAKLTRPPDASDAKSGGDHESRIRGVVKEVDDPKREPMLDRVLKDVVDRKNDFAPLKEDPLKSGKPR